MTTERTEQEIARQVEGLEAMKKWLPQFSFFGDANWDMIDLQIDVLKGRENSETYYNDDDENINLYDAALQAENWLDGLTDEDLFEQRPE